jgi:hypothetical protein
VHILSLSLKQLCMLKEEYSEIELFSKNSDSALLEGIISEIKGGRYL